MHKVDGYCDSAAWLAIGFLLFGELLSVCVKCCSADMLNAMSNRVNDLTVLIVVAGMLDFVGWNFVYNVDL